MEVNEMIADDIVPDLETRAWRNCHQRGFIQRQIETDGETHGQAELGEFCGRRGGRIVEVRKVKDIIRTQTTESTNQYS